MTEQNFDALSFAPLTLSALTALVAHAANLPVYDTPEDPATPERIAAHHAQAGALAAAALQHALCSTLAINIVNDGWCGPVTVATTREFIESRGDAVLAALVKAHWIASESATADLRRRPEGWLDAIATAA